MNAAMNRRAIAVLACAALLAGGCATVGPNYERPAFTTPAQYKAEGWVPAAPADAIERGTWWTLFDDSVLNDLAARVQVSNQNVAAAAAAYEQARAFVREQRASLFPSVSLDGAASRTGAGGGRGSSGNYRVTIGASWEPDVWGRLRRTVEAAGASAQASEADLASATLAAQGELVSAYLGLRLTDAQLALTDETVAAYQRSFEIARNRYDVGVAPKTDMLQAQTQLANAQADALALRRQRVQFENAIAVLVGETPSTFAIAAVEWKPVVPTVPVGVPSTLVQRRPDVAAAERRVASANAQIGVAEAGYFPSFDLTGSIGVAASTVASIANASSLLWAIGASVAQALFDAGKTSARVAEARAAQEQAVARYRQTALTAFQDVENLLAATRILEQQEALRREASQAADQAMQTVENRYRAGLVGYTEVVVAQTTALAARRATLQVTGDRQTTAVALIQAMGGGWREGG